MEKKAKKRQAPKKGRVYRIPEDVVPIIEMEHQEGETYTETFRRVFGAARDVRYVLPSDLHEHIEDARGKAVMKVAKVKGEGVIERPLAVRVKG